MHTRRLAGRVAILAVVAALALAGTGCDGGSKTTSASIGGPATSEALPDSETQAGVEPCTFAGTPEAKAGPVDTYVKLLTDVRVGSHGCYVPRPATPPGRSATRSSISNLPSPRTGPAARST